MKKIGIIAGNRLLPLLLAKRIKQKNANCEVVAICFKGETSLGIKKYADRTYWLNIGKLSALRNTIKKEGLGEWIMAGQINPLYIFRRKYWDDELSSLINNIKDFRPHTVFEAMINYLEKDNTTFLDSTLYLREDLAQVGVMNGLSLSQNLTRNIDFGVNMVSKFVELDIGQVLGVKACSVVALESLEGTDRTIKRAYALAGANCTILKFSKANQDLRFDIPVVGLATLRFLKRIKAASLVLEAKRVIILEKEKFLSSAQKWGIPVVGRNRK